MFNYFKNVIYLLLKSMHAALSNIIRYFSQRNANKDCVNKKENIAGIEQHFQKISTTLINYVKPTFFPNIEKTMNDLKTILKKITTKQSYYAQHNSPSFNTYKSNNSVIASHSFNNDVKIIDHALPSLTQNNTLLLMHPINITMDISISNTDTPKILEAKTYTSINIKSRADSQDKMSQARRAFIERTMNTHNSYKLKAKNLKKHTV